MPQKQKITTIVRRRPRRQTKVVRVTNVQKTKRRRRVRRKRAKSMPMLNNLVNLIADPCHGPLIRAIGNGSVVERVRTTRSINAATSAVNGYVVWFPDYHNNGSGANSAFNCFLWEGATSNTVPTNTAANPLGLVSTNTTGVMLPDPAATLVASAIFSRGQSVAACMQFDYLGPLSSISGQVAIIKNLPYKAFATNDTAENIIAPTVDDLFAFASERERIQITGHEVVWRPSDATSILRDNGATRGWTNTAPDLAFTTGDLGVNQAVSNTTTANSLGVCIAWKGIPASANNFQINLIKTINLELAPSGNTVEPSFGPSNLDEGPSPFDHVTSWLDRNVPHWQTKAINTINSVAGTLAKSYTQNVGISLLRGAARSRSLLTNF